jgi:hypothetical protein
MLIHEITYEQQEAAGHRTINWMFYVLVTRSFTEGAQYYPILSFGKDLYEIKMDLYVRI